MAGPIVRLVDRVPRSAVDSPTVLLELNDDAPWSVLHEEFSLGTPNFSGDPDSVGAEDGWREIRLALSTTGTASTASAAQSTLARLLLRREVVLSFQHTAANPPTYFRLWRSQLPPLVWDGVVGDGGAWVLDATISADPFGYGPTESAGPVNIVNNPVTGCFYALTSAKGDAPAPLNVQIDPNGFDMPTFLLAASSTLDAAQSATYTSGNTPTPLTNASEVAIASATGGTATRVLFTDPSYQPRLSHSLTPKMGDYRAVARVRAASATTYTVGLSSESSEGVSITPVITPQWGWVDLGLVTFPRGNVPEYGELADNEWPGSVALWASQDSGSGNLDIDVVMYIPVWLVDSSRSSLAYISQSSTPLGLLVNSERLLLRSLDAAGDPANTRVVPTMDGGYPMVDPAANTVVHLLSRFGVSSGEAITDSVDVTFSWTPRYLHLRPDADA